jgi:hypothetical protein
MFVLQAAESEPEEPDRFAANLEAAIVFGGGITNHLQSQYRHRAPGFDGWYSQKQKEMIDEPLMWFLYRERSLLLKQRPTELKRDVRVFLHAEVFASASINIKVIRDRPWYRTAPSLLWQDFWRPFKLHIHNWNDRRTLRRRQREAERAKSRAEIRQVFYFDSPSWDQLPALELVRQYLDKLERLVNEAEQTFGF